VKEIDTDVCLSPEINKSVTTGANNDTYMIRFFSPIFFDFVEKLMCICVFSQFCFFYPMKFKIIIFSHIQSMFSFKYLTKSMQKNELIIVKHKKFEQVKTEFQTFRVLYL